jgi:hypothetical protein
MKLEDLQRLKLAIDTGNMGYFHSDLTVAFAEVVEELIEYKEALTTVESEVGVYSVLELVEIHNELRREVAGLEAFKTGVAAALEAHDRLLD